MTDEPLWVFIKKIREKHGLTQKEFADRIGCSQSYITIIEKPVAESKKTASLNLLKRIAKKFSADDEERKTLERRLLLLLARITAPPEIVEKYLSEEKEEIVSTSNESMPDRFIARLRQDISTLQDNNVLDTLTISRQILEGVIKGERIITKPIVVEIAQKTGQPVTEYIALAGYMPDEVACIFDNPQFIRFFNTVKMLNNEQINSLGIILNSIVDMFVMPNPKKFL